MKFKMVPKPLLWFLAFLSAAMLDDQAAEPGIMTEEDDPAIVLDVNFPAFKKRKISEWPSAICRLFDSRPTRTWLEKTFDLDGDPGGALRVTAFPGASLGFCCSLSRADDGVSSGLQFEIAAACPSATSFVITLRLNGQTESLVVKFQDEEGKADVSRTRDGESAKRFAKEFSFDPISFDPAQMGKKNLVLKLADWKKVSAQWGDRQLFQADLDDPVHSVNLLYLATDKELLVQRITVRRLD